MKTTHLHWLIVENFDSIFLVVLKFHKFLLDSAKFHIQVIMSTDKYGDLLTHLAQWFDGWPILVIFWPNL
jgi:hypothetical protein